MVELSNRGIESDIDYKVKYLEGIEREKYPNGLTKIVYIKDNIFSIEGNTGNIYYFKYGNGEIIINIGFLRKINNFQKYSKLIGVEEVKNESCEYEMFVIKEGGKRTKLDKYSVEYFEVWQDISFLQGRDLILHIYKGDSRKTVMKVEDRMLDMMTENGEIRLVDLVVFLQKGNITKEQFEKYITQLKALLLEQIGDGRFGLLDNNFKFHITYEGNRYEINTGKVNEDEINYLFKAGLISQEFHKLTMEKYYELEKLEKEKKGEITKTLDNLKEEINGIAN